MASNKTTGRKTNQGYLSRQNLPSLKKSLRQNHNNHYEHKKTNSKKSSDDKWNNSIYNNKNQEVGYIEQSQEEDSDYQYSFNNRPQNSKNANNRISNTNSKGVRHGSEVNVEKNKSSQQNKGKCMVKVSQMQTLNKRLPNQQSQKHIKTKNIPTNTTTKQLNNTQSITNQQDKVQMLQQLLKQAHYQNQLLREKLLISQDHYSTLNQEYSQLQQNYQELQKSYQKLKESHQKLQEKYNSALISSYKQVPKQSQLQFIAECQQEMERLKSLVKDLSEQKSILQLRQFPSERQEIKDRIIMKLQDQLITHKLLLQQAKLQNNNQHNNKHSPLNDILLLNYNNNKNHQHNHNCSSYQQSQRNPLQEISTNHTRYSPSQHKYNLNNFSATKHNKLSYQ